MGFAPADDPRFVVAVSLLNPRNGNSGGALAGPVFADVMGFTLRADGRRAAGDDPHRRSSSSPSDRPRDGRVASGRCPHRPVPAPAARDRRAHSSIWPRCSASQPLPELAADVGHRDHARLPAGPPRRPLRRAARRHAPRRGFAGAGGRRGASPCSPTGGRRAAVAAGLPVLVVADPAGALGRVAARVYGEPARDLLMLGVTGTNGKTTTAHLLEAGLARGRSPHRA